MLVHHPESAVGVAHKNLGNPGVGNMLVGDAGGARRVCEKLKGRGILTKETHHHAIRITPPLILTPGQADWIAEQFKAALN